MHAFFCPPSFMGVKCGEGTVRIIDCFLTRMTKLAQALLSRC